VSGSSQQHDGRRHKPGASDAPKQAAQGKQTLAGQAAARLGLAHPGAALAPLLPRVEPPEQEVDLDRAREHDEEANGGESLLDAARRIAAGGGAPLPHLEPIQKAFGRHGVAEVQAHVGGEAAELARRLGSPGFTYGQHVGFAGAPDLHLAAHEAAHVVQQRSGAQVPGGVGRAGDAFELHADAVADRVVAGTSAEPLLEPFQGHGGAPSLQLSGKGESMPGIGGSGDGGKKPNRQERREEEKKKKKEKKTTEDKGSVTGAARILARDLDAWSGGGLIAATCATDWFTQHQAELQPEEDKDVTALGKQLLMLIGFANKWHEAITVELAQSTTLTSLSASIEQNASLFRNAMEKIKAILEKLDALKIQVQQRLQVVAQRELYELIERDEAERREREEERAEKRAQAEAEERRRERKLESQRAQEEAEKQEQERQQRAELDRERRRQSSAEQKDTKEGEKLDLSFKAEKACAGKALALKKIEIELKTDATPLLEWPHAIGQLAAFSQQEHELAQLMIKAAQAILAGEQLLVEMADIWQGQDLWESSSQLIASLKSLKQRLEELQARFQREQLKQQKRRRLTSCLTSIGFVGGANTFMIALPGCSLVTAKGAVPCHLTINKDDLELIVEQITDAQSCATLVFGKCHVTLEALGFASVHTLTIGALTENPHAYCSWKKGSLALDRLSALPSNDWAAWDKVLGKLDATALLVLVVGAVDLLAGGLESQWTATEPH